MAEQTNATTGSTHSSASLESDGKSPTTAQATKINPTIPAMDINPNETTCTTMQRMDTKSCGSSGGDFFANRHLTVPFESITSVV